MAQSLTPFAQRRRRNAGIALLAGAAIPLLVHLYQESLRNPAFPTGWSLLALLLFLAIYGLRKKLRTLPLQPNSSWLQWHVYVGFAATVMFVVHAGIDLPNGRLDTLLWCFTVGLLGSGILGLVAFRLLPPRMAGLGERVLFERIPALRRQIAAEVEELARTSVSQSKTAVISDTYINDLEPFLRGSHVMTHLLQLQGPQHRRLRDIAQLRQYLDASGKQIADEIEQRVVAKNELDYQYAMQLLLKWWLFVHVPLAYAIMPVIVVHVIAGYAFSGGAP